jgi:AcrR family transcriptional regulator
VTTQPGAPRPASPARGSTARGRSSRSAVLAAAAASASTDGLEGLTIGRLAEDVGMSKSGLVTLFGSKTELQLAVVAHAREMFTDAIRRRLAGQPDAWPRTWRLVEAWMGYERDDVFPGGCLLTSLTVEYASRTGRVRDEIERLGREWLAGLAAAAAEDLAQGRLPAATDPEQVAFGLRAVFLATNWYWKLFGEELAFTRGRGLAAAVLGTSHPEGP